MNIISIIFGTVIGVLIANILTGLIFNLFIKTLTKKIVQELFDNKYYAECDGKKYALLFMDIDEL